MINTEKLSAILVSYKKDFISHQWKDEKYKWVAVKHFQDHWDINATNFPDMFTKATEKTDNLLAAKNFYPKNMLIEFAKIEPETVRAMFMNLFNEAKELSDRVEKFRDDAEALRMKHNSGAWNQHYQNLNAISTYLWLRYPDKYYIYKYSEYVEVAKTLESSFVPKRSISTVNLIGGFKFYDEICDYLEKDYELVNMLKSVLSDDCYPDPALKTLTIDVGFYVSRCYSKDPGKNEDNWFPADYSPNITTDKWLELLADKSVFDINSLKIMKRMKDYGGAATCKQLSEKYGGTKNFYNVGSSALAKRIAKVTGCPVLEENNENSKWWPVLYVGRYADKDTQGSYIWKLRDELSEALDRFDLSEVPLFEEYTTEENNLENRHYWWLNANPKIWSFSNLEVGGTQVYTLYNENGNKRRIFQNFLDARKGDIVIGYEANPVKKIVALARVARENDGKVVYFEKTENLTSPIDYNTLKESPELQNMEFFVNPNGTLFKLTKDEFNVIIDIIREANPVKPGTDETYSKEDFLKEVYMAEEDYDTLCSLLMNKQNFILQGPPGVGKTFAARRLAYSIMGEKDDNRIEFIQFHQNYTYEDFIMGYKPKDEGFELQYGIFYRFCQKAANEPGKPYFFIIDEINRGNLSKIFGELLMLIERDYRGVKITLAYSGMRFFVPKNLYIIGMMNTADRSLALIDYALRRRFCFFEMAPAFNSKGFRAYQSSFNNETFNTLIERIKELNKEIIADSSLGRGFCIGHSYFCGQKECTEEWMKEVVEYDILPMLNEYWFDDPDKLQRWENILRGVFND